MATSDIPVAVVLDEAGCANGDRMQELQDERQRKLMEFGWFASYGAMTSMEKGNVKRAEAERMSGFSVKSGKCVRRDGNSWQSEVTLKRFVRFFYDAVKTNNICLG